MKNYESNVISLNKIWANLKKYFWVLILCVIVSLGISYVAAAGAEDNTTATEAPTRKAYGSDIHIMVHWGIAESAMDETALTYCQEDMKTLAKYLSTTEFAEVLNKKLSENGYEILRADEKIVYDASSYNMIRVVACGYAENGRLQFMLKSISEILEAEAKALYDVESFEIISEPYIQNVKVLNGNYSLMYGAVTDLDKQAPAPTPVQDTASTMDKWKQNTNFIVYILAGLVFGAFVLFMIMVLDSKVYTETEIGQILDAPFLGKTKSEGEQVLLAEKVIGKCKKDNAANLGVLVLGKAAESVVSVQGQMKDASVCAEIITDIESSKEAMKSLSKTERVIVGIELNKVNKKQILWTMETLEYFGIDIIGYFCF